MSVGPERPATTTGFADFNGDGLSDLATGIEWEDVGVEGSEVMDAGGVQVIYGSPGGLSSVGNEFITEDSPGLPGKSEAFNYFGGDGLTWGDFNGDGFDELAVGIRGQAVAGFLGAGAVTVIYGSAEGLLPISTAQVWHQGTPGPGRPRLPGGVRRRPRER